jgi:integrase
MSSSPRREGSIRAVPLQAIALEALAQLPAGAETDLAFPALRGGYFDLHNFRRRAWRPAQRAAGVTPLRRVYDLRHTFATFVRHQLGSTALDPEQLTSRATSHRKEL